MSKIILETDILSLEIQRNNERFKEIQCQLEKYHSIRYNLEADLLKICMKMTALRKEREELEAKIK